MISSASLCIAPPNLTLISNIYFIRAACAHARRFTFDYFEGASMATIRLLKRNKFVSLYNKQRHKINYSLQTRYQSDSTSPTNSEALATFSNGLVLSF